MTAYVTIFSEFVFWILELVFGFLRKIMSKNKESKTN